MALELVSDKAVGRTDIMQHFDNGAAGRRWRRASRQSPESTVTAMTSARIAMPTATAVVRHVVRMRSIQPRGSWSSRIALGTCAASVLRRVAEIRRRAGHELDDNHARNRQVVTERKAGAEPRFDKFCQNSARVHRLATSPIPALDCAWVTAVRTSASISRPEAGRLRLDGDFTPNVETPSRLRKPTIMVTPCPPSARRGKVAMAITEDSERPEIEPEGTIVVGACGRERMRSRSGQVVPRLCCHRLCRRRGVQS